jgi:predicted metal-dependent hydrolase
VNRTARFSDSKSLLFAEAAASGLLIANPKGELSWVQFWDGIGAYLDFTQPKTLAWWKAKVKETLLDYGLTATWNDNNEFEIWIDKALAHGFGQPRDSGQIARYLVRLIDGEIVVQRPLGSRTPVAYSLENWLRRQARAEIENQLETVTTRLRQRPRSGYVMGQRTKWGNCSASRNLSFNWRLILAPDFVLRYLVTHEAVHLAVPDHSAKFWLTVQSLCPETERAKQWLSANGLRLAVKLDSIYEETCL